MRKICIYNVGVIALLAFTSCQGTMDEKEQSSEKLISIRSGLTSVISARAPIASFENTPIQVLRGSDNGTLSFSESWPATVANTGLVTFKPVRIYPLTREEIVLRGFCPTPLEEVTGNRSRYTYSLANGETDILCSNLIRGSYETPITETLKFDHLTSQIRILMNNDESFPVYRKITKIELEGLQVDAALDLVSGTLTFTGDTKPVVIYEDSKGVAPPIHTYIQVGKTIMIQPGATNVKVKLKFDDGAETTQPLYFDRVADNGPTPLIGVSYSVYFILTSFRIIPKITIQEWKTGDQEMDMPNIW